MTGKRSTTRPKTRTAILHIGHSKTGSTSIQQALTGYDDGSTFAATFGGEHVGVSAEIYTAFSSDFLSYLDWVEQGYDEAEIQLMRERFRSEFSAMLMRRDRTRIIVSAESIWGLSDPDKVGLVEFIKRHGWDVRIVVYMREPLSWIASEIAQRIKAGRPLDFSARENSKCRNRLTAFIKLLPREQLHVRCYDRSMLIGNDVVADFSEIVGVNLSHDIPRVNESLPLPALKLLLLFNRSRILARGAIEIYNARNRLVQMLVETYAGGERLDPSLCAGLVDMSETDWLYETFGIDFRPKAPLPETSAADLEAFLTDLSDVDLSGLNKLLADYGVRHENFTTAEEKLHRLFYAVLMELAAKEHDRAQIKRTWLPHGIKTLFRKPSRKFMKNLRDWVLKRLSKFRLLTTPRREKLLYKATRLCVR